MKIYTTHISETNKYTDIKANCNCLTLSFRPRPALADNWYSLSYLYFSPVGILVTMITGLIVSAISGKMTLSHMPFGEANTQTVIYLFLTLGGCKQKKVQPELFIRKSDLICFGFRNSDSEVRPRPV